MGQGYLKYVKPFLPTLIVIVGWFGQPFGKTVDILFFITAFLSLIGATLYAYKIGIAAQKQNEAVRIKQFLSHQRHDWMNDVQILLGYLTLGKYDRMQNYLDQQVQKANDERLITQLQYAPLAVSLIMLAQRYLQWSIKIKAENIAEYTIQEEKKALAIIDYIFPWLEKQLQDIIIDLQLNIYITKKEVFTLTISIIKGSDQRPISIHMNDLSQIRKTIRKCNGDLTFDNYHNEIQVIVN